MEYKIENDDNISLIQTIESTMENSFVNAELLS